MLTLRFFGPELGPSSALRFKALDGVPGGGVEDGVKDGIIGEYGDGILCGVKAGLGDGADNLGLVSIPSKAACLRDEYISKHRMPTTDHVCPVVD